VGRGDWRLRSYTPWPPLRCLRPPLCSLRGCTRLRQQGLRRNPLGCGCTGWPLPLERPPRSGTLLFHASLASLCALLSSADLGITMCRSPIWCFWILVRSWRAAPRISLSGSGTSTHSTASKLLVAIAARYGQWM
jgi:hypothetical protein